MKGTLTKIHLLPDGKLAEHPPRTDSITGEVEYLPMVNRICCVVGESLDPNVKARGGFRYWTTSMVKKILSDKIEDRGRVIKFETRNSLYELVITMPSAVADSMLGAVHE